MKGKNNKPKPITYRGSDASMIGAQEPQWPEFSVQKTWTAEVRSANLSAALSWYNYVCDKKMANTWLVEWIGTCERRKKLSRSVKGRNNIPTIYGWLVRMSAMGLVLTMQELRKIKAALDKQSESANNAFTDALEAPKKPSVADYITVKLRECLGAIMGDYDAFRSTGYISVPNTLEHLTKYNIPANRIKEVSARIQKHHDELAEVMKGDDSDLTEGYSNFTKREIKKMMTWLETTIEQTHSYGTHKVASRKPRSKKPISPQKAVSKLRYMQKDTDLKLESIDPTNILKAEDLWVYHTKKRLLCLYTVDDLQSALHINRSKIVGFSVTRSVAKKLRNPEKQLKEFLALGKPAAKKWFSSIRAVEQPLNGVINDQILLLKAHK